MEKYYLSTRMKEQRGSARLRSIPGGGSFESKRLAMLIIVKIPNAIRRANPIRMQGKSKGKGEGRARQRFNSKGKYGLRLVLVGSATWSTKGAKNSPHVAQNEANAGSLTLQPRSTCSLPS